MVDQDDKKVRLDVEGMTCANCAAGITRHLSNKGFSDVSTNFATGEVVFGAAKQEQINVAIKEINSLGYHVLDKKEPKKGLSMLEIKFYVSLLFTLPLLAHMVFSAPFLHDPFVQLFLSTPVFIIGFLHFGKSALGSIRSGLANMDVLIVIGSSSAYLYSIIQLLSGHAHEGIFFETSAAIVTFVLLGNLIEHISVKRTTSAIEDLTRLQPDQANIVVKHGDHEHIETIPASSVRLDDIVQVNTGDRLPVDGIVVYGNGSVDESMLSGEPVPVPRESGDAVRSGTIVTNGSFRVKTTGTGSNTTLARIIEMVKSAQEKKPQIQKIGDKVSSIFVPVVLGIAAITFIAWLAIDGDLKKSLMNSIAVLVISCPCAMGLATPTAVMVGLGRAAKKGILIKGGNTIQELAEVKTIVFDKTGTITSGKFQISGMNTLPGFDSSRTNDIIYSLEKHSSHPIAQSLREHLESRSAYLELNNIIEKKGFGIEATDPDGKVLRFGSYRYVRDIVSSDDHSLYLVIDNQLAATIDIIDTIRDGAAQMISELNKAGIETILLSGDKARNCEKVAKETGIKKVYSEKLPEEKLKIIEELSAKNLTAMVGDGINDAPALSRAQVGISLSDASDIAMNASQLIMLRNGNELLNISEALLISRKTLKTIRQNLFWAFIYNVVAIPVAAFGFLNVYGPLIGALSMAFSDVVVIGNSLRLRSSKLDS